MEPKQDDLSEISGEHVMDAPSVPRLRTLTQKGEEAYF